MFLLLVFVAEPAFYMNQFQKVARQAMIGDEMRQGLLLILRAYEKKIFYINGRSHLRANNVRCYACVIKDPAFLVWKQ